MSEGARTWVGEEDEGNWGSGREGEFGVLWSKCIVYMYGIVREQIKRIFAKKIPPSIPRLLNSHLMEASGRRLGSQHTRLNRHNSF